MEKGLHDEILNLLRSNGVMRSYEIYDCLKRRPAGEITQAIDVLKEEGFVSHDITGSLRITSRDVSTFSDFQKSTEKRPLDYFYRVGEEVNEIQDEQLMSIFDTAKKWSDVDESPFPHQIMQKCVELEELLFKYHNSTRKTILIFHLLQKCELRNKQRQLKRRKTK